MDPENSMNERLAPILEHMIIHIRIVTIIPIMTMIPSNNCAISSKHGSSAVLDHTLIVATPSA
jgi:hypothetical protein